MRYSFEKRQKKRAIESLIKQLKKVQWRYKNSILLMVSIFLAYFLLKTRYLENSILELKDFSYIGAFFSGILFTFSLTVAPSTAIFYSIGKKLNPAFTALLGAGGAFLGDYLIFRFVKVKLLEEIKLISEEINSKSRFYFQNSIFYRLFPFSNLALSRKFKIMMMKIFRSRLWRAFVKIISGLIIASPLPDEIGILLLGATKQKTKEFIVYSYFLNFLGIFGIAYFASVR